jgi:hypothetical protein
VKKTVIDTNLYRRVTFTATDEGGAHLLLESTYRATPARVGANLTRDEAHRLHAALGDMLGLYSMPAWEYELIAGPKPADTVKAEPDPYIGPHDRIAAYDAVTRRAVAVCLPTDARAEVEYLLTGKAPK